MKIDKVIFWGIIVIAFTVALTYSTNKLMDEVKK
jgi:hypothetical protein